ncbi:MAG: Holliday junction branch migration protein RuvA [Armatimonadetes bacterium]|nr:Holliday junction branch migration protein RuvA [Armatimonadota bacterium]
MIAQLTGRIAVKEISSVVLDVGGVGYRLSVPFSVSENLASPNETVTLYTHLVVREDELTLYGFLNQDELKVFEMLIGVNGVGPKVALSLLSASRADELAQAIANRELSSLTRTPGVGPKLAQRLILELADKMAELSLEVRVAALTGKPDLSKAQRDDVVEALVNLGYSRADARRAADIAISNLPVSEDHAAVIRAALNWLTAGK